MISLPIPERLPTADSPRYDELTLAGADVGRLLRGLHPRFDPHGPAHLDPDIRGRNGHPGLSGQAGPAAGHLVNQGVGQGDLFLFFGLFREAVPDGSGGYRFVQPRREFHAIWGYLEVGRVLDAGAGDRVAWVPGFPHFTKPDRGRPNRVHVARERLSFDRARPGWGAFRFREELRLTKPGAPGPSLWALPGCFREAKLTYHPRASWGPDGERSAGRGQEFVCTATPAIAQWARRLIAQS